MLSAQIQIYKRNAKDLGHFYHAVQFLFQFFGNVLQIGDVDFLMWTDLGSTMALSLHVMSSANTW